VWHVRIMQITVEQVNTFRSANSSVTGNVTDCHTTEIQLNIQSVPRSKHSRLGYKSQPVNAVQ